MLITTYIEVRLVDEELADQVWTRWYVGKIDDQTGILAWLRVATRVQPEVGLADTESGGLGEKPEARRDPPRLEVMQGVPDEEYGKQDDAADYQDLKENSPPNGIVPYGRLGRRCGSQRGHLFWVRGHGSPPNIKSLFFYRIRR